MKCSKCTQKAVYLEPTLCKEHFIQYVENTAYNTIRKHKLLDKKDKIIVAVSGGKDSISVLYLTHKLFPKTQALAIDEGIKGYRQNTLKDLKEFCKKHKITLTIVSIKDNFGKTLDVMVKRTKLGPCTICGVLRRYLLNKYSKGFDKLVTGHNLDDEAQSIMMNILKGTVEMNARLGPKTGVKEYDEFVQRVKPLYFLKEKEIMTYSYLMNFNINFVECPYAEISYRNYVRDSINDLERKMPGTKYNIVSNFLKILPKLKKNFYRMQGVKLCDNCGEPSRLKYCKSCSLIDELKIKKIKA